MAGLGVLAAPGGTAFADPTAAAESPAASAAADRPATPAAAPLAANTDVANFPFRTSLNVLTNDVGPSGEPTPFPGVVGVNQQTGAASGTLRISPDGNVSYSPGPCFAGTVTATYLLVDSANTDSTDTGTVRLNVAGSASPVRAANDTARVDRDTGIAQGNVLTNDCGRRGPQVTLRVLGTPSRGTLILAGDGTFTYRRNPGDRAAGSDSFRYQVTNAGNSRFTATATVRLTLPAVLVPSGSGGTPSGAGGVVPPGTEETGQIGNIALPPPVQAPLPQQPQPQLPATGTDVTPIALTGVGLVLAGSAAVFVTRRRREPVATEVVAAD